METVLHKMITNFYNVDLNKAKLEVFIYMCVCVYVYIYMCIVVGPMLNISSQSSYSKMILNKIILGYFSF